ncbi:hypothetical protein TSOC_004941 [Tetrabaena socialis]|uniref:Cupin domain-containing protein n=1 Tax=Tetrabaena socialis TaxID=47790 RepID=A0A2J8A7K6_9CHLO|nr:hypothetical protein TSOC_004941 [Tetrabaena socialis]|eukprot:PNH08498.1 hypothetical protein TSOC_004941 [Tetrabaena socialis]
MRSPMALALLGLAALLSAPSLLAAELCGLEPTPACGGHDYAGVFRAHERGLDFDNLPGYTRSAHRADHALIGVESRVFAGQRGWSASSTAHLVSPARGANFAMYLADMAAGSSADPARPGVERFVLVLRGEAVVRRGKKKVATLPANSYAYFPPNATETLSSPAGAGLLVYERVYGVEGGVPSAQVDGERGGTPDPRAPSPYAG